MNMLEGVRGATEMCEMHFKSVPKNVFFCNKLKGELKFSRNTVHNIKFFNLKFLMYSIVKLTFILGKAIVVQYSVFSKFYSPLTIIDYFRAVLSTATKLFHKKTLYCT
jgi:hypothetical protein